MEIALDTENLLFFGGFVPRVVAWVGLGVSINQENFQLLSTILSSLLSFDHTNTSSRSSTPFNRNEEPSIVCPHQNALEGFQT